MAGTACEESAAGRSSEGLSSRQGCDSGDALTEWRSCEQVENGTPSTSPPYWDTDDSDNDGGLKPCDLYGKYTWKIEKFSTINKRELKSSVFEVGGYRCNCGKLSFEKLSSAVVSKLEAILEWLQNETGYKLFGSCIAFTIKTSSS